MYDYVAEILPPPSEWHLPPGYPLSTALCVLDAVWSINSNYDSHVVPVLNRYIARRGYPALDACTDDASDLADAIAAVGGAEPFASDVVANRQRTSTRSGILKAEAVLSAATLLGSAGVSTTADLGANQNDLRRDWIKIPGQRSGVSWRYLLMLAGVEAIKPDRMIRRFLRSATNATLDDEQATEVLRTVAETLPGAVTLRQLDHAIWRHESGRARNERAQVAQGRTR